MEALHTEFTRQFSDDLIQATKRSASNVSIKRRKSLKAEEIHYIAEQICAEFQFDPTIPIEKLIGTIPSIMVFVEPRVKSGGAKGQAAEQIFNQIVDECLSKGDDWKELAVSIKTTVPYIMGTLIAFEKGHQTLHPNLGGLDWHEESEILSTDEELHRYFESRIVDNQCVDGVILALKSVYKVENLNEDERYRWASDKIQSAIQAESPKQDLGLQVLGFARGLIPQIQKADTQHQRFLLSSASNQLLPETAAHSRSTAHSRCCEIL